MFRIRQPVILCILATGLAGCGGGGSGTASPSGTEYGATGIVTSSFNFNLSGSISQSDATGVDGDTNDPNQLNRRANNTIGTAQPLTAPVLLVGTVNQTGSGSAGTNLAAGDPDDVFVADLVPGQVVELEAGNDQSLSDVDLYLHSSDGRLLGASDGPVSRYECIRVVQAGRYYIDVHAFRGATTYNLRIGAPGTAGSCVNMTVTANFDPAELLAVPRPDASASQTGSRSARSALSNAMRAAGVQNTSKLGQGPLLLRLPAQVQAQASTRKVTAQSRSRALAATTNTTATATTAASTATVSDLPAALRTLQMAKQLRADGTYLDVHPNWWMERDALVGTYPPSDTSYAYQRWHYELINLPAAMTRLTALTPMPTRRPVVAVIDDGVVLDHPDLAPQLLSNGRAFISNGADGDANTASGDITAQRSDNPVFHGTHIAGTIGASTFDGRYGAAVAPMAQLLPLRVFPPTGMAKLSDVINAMLYAAGLPNNSGTVPSRKADVINLSMGADTSCPQAYQTAIDQVRAAGVAVVVAAGNSARNDQGRPLAVSTPANCRGVIAVSATDARKQLAYYSNSGVGITVAAPGGDPSQSTSHSGAPDSIFSTSAAFDMNGRRFATFGPMTGTSMAAPHVSGVIALMRFARPDLTPDQIDALFAAGSLTDDIGASGHDSYFGAGLINAGKAVQAALALTASVQPLTGGEVIATPATLDLGSFAGSVVLELSRSGATAEAVQMVTADSTAVQIEVSSVDPATGLGRYTITVDREKLGAGAYTATLTVHLAPSRTFAVPLAFSKLTSARPAAAGRGDSGPVYVLLVDPDRKEVVKTVAARLGSDGLYRWSVSGYDRRRVSVLAGSDLDNDAYLCQRSEPCGAYPQIGTGGVNVLELKGHRSDLDFQIAPVTGATSTLLQRELLRRSLTTGSQP